VGDECVGENGSVVTGWKRMGGDGEGWGKRVCERAQNKLWDREAVGLSTGEGWRVKGLRVEMRG
jgi:hypothetical protein